MEMTPMYFQDILTLTHRLACSRLFVNGAREERRTARAKRAEKKRGAPLTESLEQSTHRQV